MSDLRFAPSTSQFASKCRFENCGTVILQSLRCTLSGFRSLFQFRQGRVELGNYPLLLRCRRKHELEALKKSEGHSLLTACTGHLEFSLFS